MPSFARTAAFAALSLSAFASAQAFSNVTSPSVSVPGWVYVGCESSASNFKNFTRVETTTAMTVERCLLDCSNYAYAGVYGPSCYCSNSLGDAKIVADSKCTTTCPANTKEICGGKVSTSRKRQIVLGTLLSVYQRLAVVPAGVVYTTLVTNVYVNVNVNLGTFVTATYSSIVTVTGCGCANPKIPIVTLTTTSIYCPICVASAGSPSYVTVTLPAGVTAGVIAATGVIAGPGVITSTITAAKPAVFTGAARHLGAGSLGGIVAAVGAGMALL